MRWSAPSVVLHKIDLDVDADFATSASVVEWNGTPLPTTNMGLLQVQIPESYVTTIGYAQITVVNPGPEGSCALQFQCVVSFVASKRKRLGRVRSEVSGPNVYQPGFEYCSTRSARGCSAPAAGSDASFSNGFRGSLPSSTRDSLDTSRMADDKQPIYTVPASADHFCSKSPQTASRSCKMRSRKLQGLPLLIA